MPFPTEHVAPPEALDAITAAGIDVIGMANNHSLDFGQEGFAQTLAAIGERKAPVIGVGENEAAAYRPWTATVKGNRIAILDATAVMDSNLVASWTATARRWTTDWPFPTASFPSLRLSSVWHSACRCC